MLHLNDLICLLALKLVALQAGTFSDPFTPLRLHALSVPGFHHNYTCTYYISVWNFIYLALKVMCTLPRCNVSVRSSLSLLPCPSFLLSSAAGGER